MTAFFSRSLLIVSLFSPPMGLLSSFVYMYVVFSLLRLLFL